MAKREEGMAEASRRREKGVIGGERGEGRGSNYEVSMERSGELPIPPSLVSSPFSGEKC